MKVESLLTISTLAFAILYFLLRGFGKASGSFTVCSFYQTSKQVKNNLPVSLLGDSSEAFFVLNIVGVSVILSEIFGPLLLKQGLLRSGEGRRQIQNLKDIALD